MTDRVMPHSLEAERAVLGAALLTPEAWTQASAILAPDDWYREAHRLIAAALAKLAARGVPPDLVPLVDELRTTGKLDEVGGPAYLAGLVDGLPRGSNVEHYAGLVREKSRLRQLAAAGQALAAAALEASTPAPELARAAAQRLAAISLVGKRGPVLADAAAFSYSLGLDAVEQRAAPTGFVDLDQLIGGLRPGEVSLLAARPGVGKSSSALAIALSVAQSVGPAAYFSPEMTQEALAGRLLAWRSHVPSAVVERRTASVEQWAAFGEAVGSFGDLPLYLDDSARTVADVASWSRRIHQERGLALVVVDYLQKLAPGSRGRSREEEVAVISSELTNLAKDLRVPVLALSQLARAPEDRKDKRPHLTDLRESGSLEQDAGLVLFLFREELHKPTAENAGLAEVIVGKNRNGPVGSLTLAFRKEFARFDNIVHEGI